MANESFWSLLSCSGFSAKCIDFFYLLETFLPLNSDKYFELFWCFVLGFPLSFYWLSGVKWIRMWSHRPWLRLLTKPTTILSWSIMLAPHNFVDLSCVNMHSWAELLRYEDAANSFTKDHNRRGSELSCNSAHTQAQGCTVKPVLSGHPLLSGQ